jgi:hypothetical protein
LGADVLDCHAGDPAPLLTWHNAQYDKFRVFVSTNPTFATQKINSGKKYLTATSYRFSAAKWASICAKATTALYIKVLGIDGNVPSSNPLRKLYSPTVPVTVTK